MSNLQITIGHTPSKACPVAPLPSRVLRLLWNIDFCLYFYDFLIEF